MRLLVGCPVRDRDWIIPSWFSHVEAACTMAEITPVYIFVCDRRDPTRPHCEEQARRYGHDLHFVDVLEPPVVNRQEHVWSTDPTALERMVHLRNYLLEGVRSLNPDYFFSLDSDILVRPDTIKNLLETIQKDARGFDALGQKVYLSPGKDAPSYMTLHSRGVSRKDCEAVFRVDIIMAAKLMTPKAYAVNYSWHQDGEDIGWSLKCRDQGVRLGWYGLNACKHVMEPSQLTKVDKRCGY